MNTTFRVMAALVAILVTASSPSCGPDRPAQDSSDQARLREIFGIPAGASLVSYSGYPPTVGFGQREALSISAVFRFTDGQEEEFLADAEERGWRNLPVPDSVLGAIPFRGLDVPLDADDGVYTCRTAGDNVLWASETRPVEEADQVDDIIIGVLDRTSNLLHVQVRAAY